MCPMIGDVVESKDAAAAFVVLLLDYHVKLARSRYWAPTTCARKCD